MLGESYFVRRHRLVTVVEHVIDLSKEVGSDLGGLGEKKSLLKALAKPFLFVVCGESNAGKSSLINGLVGHDLCAVETTPKTRKLQWYRHGAMADKEVGDSLEERIRPETVLKDFQFVETSGTDGMPKAQQKLTTEFMAAADFLFFVFPVGNPWAAATWDMVSALDAEALSKTVLILQQADLKGARDQEVILGHMQDLAKQRLDRVPPIIAVSGHQAMAAKMNSPVNESSLRQSGYPVLEKWISDQILGSASRRDVLKKVYRETGEVLQKAEARIEKDRSNAEGQVHFVRELENSVEAIRDRETNEFSQHAASLGEAFTRVANRSLDELLSQLGTTRSLKSLLVADRLPSEIEQSLIEGARESVEARAAGDADKLIEACREHWEGMSADVSERLSIEAPDFDTETRGFLGVKKRFVTRLGRVSRHAVMGLKLRGVLDILMAERQDQLKSTALLLLSFLSLAGIAGAMDLAWYIPLVFLFVSLVMSVLLVGKIRLARRHIVQAFREKLGVAKRDFSEALAADYKTSVRQIFLEYSTLLEDVRKHVSQTKKSVAPRLERGHRLFLQLKAIEQELE